MIAADEFVIAHAPVSQNDGAPGFYTNPRAQWQSRSQHHRIQQITFKSHQLRYGTVVEWARQGRDEIHMSGGSALQKTAARDLNDDIYLRQLIAAVAFLIRKARNDHQLASSR